MASENSELRSCRTVLICGNTGNFMQNHRDAVTIIASQKNISLELCVHPTLMFVHGCGSAASRTLNCRRLAKEASMELRMRLNVVAAIMSFAFLAAIVLGMV